MSHPRELLQQLGANARKSLSQNFLTSPHWADRLTSAVTSLPNESQAISEPAKAIWEIGPGLGALTQLLIQKTQLPITVFEYDKKLAAFLRQEYPNISLIEGDVLKAPLLELAQKAQKIAILSNLPYHLSSPLLFQWIELKPYLTHVVLTFQKEFADRLIAKVGDPSYGALSLIAQLHFRISKLGILPPGAFYPPPAVASTAVVLEPLFPKERDLSLLTSIIKAGFLHPRKKMVNNLKQVFAETDWEKILQLMGLSDKVRAEELEESKWIALAQLALTHHK